ncbi:MAG: LPS assembly protein LptD [Deltaproteobacteria bacterium]|nr:LPS assembly protein LptD [Deltaproteobacteria bacterium]
MTKLFTTRHCASHLFCLTSLIAVSFPASNGIAETVATEEWQIAADKITRYEDPKSIIAEGNVVLTKRELLPPELSKNQKKNKQWGELLEEPTSTPEKTTGQALKKDTTPRYEDRVTIQADWIAYDMDRGSVKARGHVNIKGANDEISAEEGVMDLNKETGTFTDATILRKSLDLHLEGKTVEKTGFNTYHIENGWVITCKLKNNETPPWSFASTDTTVTEGGYAVLKNATFRIKDVPVLYTPWMMVPAKNKRQTGLMFPEISSSTRNGFGFDLPLFVNVSDSTDLTLFPEYYANRGFMPGAEFRYVLGEAQKGTFMGSFLHDKLTDPSEIDYYRETGYTHTDADRYWFRGKVDHDLPSNLYTRIDLDIVSDRDYLTEFNTGFTGYTETNNRFLSMYGRNFQYWTADQRVNTAKVLKVWDSMSLETNFLAINDVRADPKTPYTPLWKLPGLDFTGSLPLADTSFTVDWNADYVNYWRENGIGGQRLDLFPRLSTPIPLGAYLESRAEVGVRNTSYMVQTNGDGVWDQSDTPNRSLFNLHGEVGTTLLRNFGLNENEATSWDHRLRPYVQYDYLPKTNQDDLPLFDQVDRIQDSNAITYGVNNFFEIFNDTKKKSGHDYGYLKVWESYDLRQEYSDRPLTPVSFKLGWTPIDNFVLSYQTNIGIYGEGVVLYSLDSIYSNSRGDSLGVNYRYSSTDKIIGSPYNSTNSYYNNTDSYNIASPFYAYYNGLRDIHEINVFAKAHISDTIFAAYRIEHSLSQSQTIAQDISLIYQPACWSVELRSNYTPGDQGIMLLFNLANIGNPLGINLAGK